MIRKIRKTDGILTKGAVEQHVPLHSIINQLSALILIYLGLLQLTYVITANTQYIFADSSPCSPLTINTRSAQLNIKINHNQQHAMLTINHKNDKEPSKSYRAAIYARGEYYTQPSSMFSRKMYKKNIKQRSNRRTYTEDRSNYKSKRP